MMVDASEIFNANILIVDDLEVNITLLGRLLGSAGYRSVTSTMDPYEVCELHRKHRYDLILLDLLMPRMDGFQVMEGLKAIEPEVLRSDTGHQRAAEPQAARTPGRRARFHQ